jgi:hypothetical protein
MTTDRERDRYLVAISLIEQLRLMREALLVDTPLHLQVRLQAECVAMAEAIAELQDRQRGASPIPAPAQGRRSSRCAAGRRAPRIAR